jgi:hypothetical protein
VTDPNGRYYLVKNYHDGYPPALDFPFHVRYDSAAMPSGVCKLYSDDLEPIILKSTTPAVSTTQTTTPKQTTPPVTTQKQTTPPATTQQPMTTKQTESTTKATTQSPTTTKPTTQPVTSQSTPAVTTSKPGKCLDNVYLLYPSDI